MSHVTDVKLKVRDLAALKEAAEACGLELREDQTSYKWYGRWVNDFSGPTAAVTQGHDPKDFGKSAHAIGIPGNRSAYEIGVVARKDDDGFDLLYDAWDGQLEPKAGKNLSKLRREYAASVASRKAIDHLAKRGFKLSRENVGNTIQLRLRAR